MRKLGMMMGLHRLRSSMSACNATRVLLGLSCCTAVRETAHNIPRWNHY